MEENPNEIILQRYTNLIELSRRNFSPQSVEMICDALVLADGLLAGKTRYDGSPLIMHSVRTAEIVINEIGLGRNSAVSTIMHDAVRMGLITAEEIGKRYGEACIGIIKGLCNISDIHPKVSDEQAEDARELIISYSTDPRIILIKLADRLEVMRSLDIFPAAKRAKKSWESLNLYAKIAHKLGLYTLKSELEDLALQDLQPEEYQYIKGRLSDTAEQREKFIAKFIVPIEAKLKAAGVKYHIKARTKSIFSIWSKMQRRHVPFDEVYDLYAIRIIIEECAPEQEKAACWNIYSMVTDLYIPNPERLRDWVSIPKSNGYESLQTTVASGDGHWVEIQIRTERMDEVAERGIAAHWRYKGVQQGEKSSEQWLARLRELLENTDTHTIQRRFDTTLSSGEIFLFTPNGDLRRMPDGSTVLDFAFTIHTSLGATCTGAKVNGKNVTIKQTLHNGDIVEILTSKTQKPKSDWLNIATTTRAKNKIRACLREEQAKVATMGREELERKLKNWKLVITFDEAVSVLYKYYKLKAVTDLYTQIASSKIDLADVKEVITKYLNKELVEEPKQGQQGQRKTPLAANDDSDVLTIDNDVRDLDYKFAKCCNPVMGDDIFGFVTVNSGITIHRKDCPNGVKMVERYPYRVIPVKWRKNASSRGFRATIRISVDDVTGILNKITDIITQEMQLNIRLVNMRPDRKENKLIGTIDLEVPNTGALDAVVHKLLTVKGVDKAYRLT